MTKPVRVLLLSASVMFTSAAANAQAMIVLLFGGKVTNPRLEMGLQLALHESFITNTSGIPRSALGIGTYIDYKMKAPSKWVLSTYITFKAPKGMSRLPVSYSVTEGLDTLTDSRINRSVTYLTLTPMARYNFTSSFSMGFGPEVGFKTLSRDKYSRDADDGELTYTVKTKGDFSKVDLGFALDFQYRLMKGKGLRLNARYVQGVTNMYASNSPFSGLNCLIHLGVGIRLGRPPAPAPEKL